MIERSVRKNLGTFGNDQTLRDLAIALPLSSIANSGYTSNDEIVSVASFRKPV